MSWTLMLTALLMGLAGSPHCAAMCGAACSGVIRVVRIEPRSPARGDGSIGSRAVAFHAGRIASYAAAGALAGGLVQGFAWLSAQTAALRPVWTLFHLAVLAWGLMLLALARQPAWAQQAGLAAWIRVRPVVQGKGGALGAGALWALMPCGLLWSAMLVASLSGGPLQGAAAMALFSIGGAAGLVAGPWLLQRIRTVGNRLRADSGTRIAGGLLAASAIFALWMDLGERIAQWCT